MRSAEQPLEVWFDGACPLCRREIALMHRLDRAELIRCVDAADADASGPLDRTTMLARLPVVTRAVESAYVCFLTFRPALQDWLK